nr:MAG TPA: hypothetical protein [Bacteriophage sp.]DAU12682.1 MAG TPA: hypothetical protein [Caudoviricetes sp.]
MCCISFPQRKPRKGLGGMPEIDKPACDRHLCRSHPVAVVDTGGD